MSILSFTVDFPGQVGVEPQIVRILSNDSYSTITASNYLASLLSQGFVISNKNVVFVNYGTDSSTFGIFIPVVTSSTITLAPYIGEGNVTLPVTDGNFAVFDGTTGKIKNGGTPGTAAQMDASNPAMPPGGLVASTPDTTVAGHMVVFGDETGSLADDGISPLLRVDVSVMYDDLEMGGSKILFSGTIGKTYFVNTIKMNKVGLNFTNGDRTISITDGTTVYTVIPEAALESLDNYQWGDTQVPKPASTSWNLATEDGANLVATYSGGMTDYDAGAVGITIFYQRAS